MREYACTNTINVRRIQFALNWGSGQQMKIAALAAVGGMMAFALPASATTIFQSIPDLAAVPSFNGLCSQCTHDGVPDGQDIGETFTLSSAATARTASFDVSNAHFWPTSVTLSIFTNAGGTVGSSIYSQTFSSFTSDVATAFATDVVTVDLGADVALSAGDYVIFVSNPANLGLPVFGGGVHHGVQTSCCSFGTASPPAVGTAFHTIGAEDIGVSLSDAAAVPEPSTWALVILSFGGVGAALRRRRTVVAA
jgi:hypothetical protein